VALTDSLGNVSAAVRFKVGHDWRYLICHKESVDAPFGIIGGSNGGTGLVVTYELTVTSGFRTARDVTVFFNVWGLFEGVVHTGCPA
jgi:hypothetical protein